MSTLSKYVNFEQSKNELKYSLEQYRAIDNNIFIDVVLAKKMSIGIDTMDEYVEIKKLWNISLNIYENCLSRISRSLFTFSC